MKSHTYKLHIIHDLRLRTLFILLFVFQMANISAQESEMIKLEEIQDSIVQDEETKLLLQMKQQLAALETRQEKLEALLIKSNEENVILATKLEATKTDKSEDTQTNTKENVVALIEIPEKEEKITVVDPVQDLLASVEKVQKEVGEEHIQTNIKKTATNHYLINKEKVTPVSPEQDLLADVQKLKQELGSNHAMTNIIAPLTRKDSTALQQIVVQISQEEAELAMAKKNNAALSNSNQSTIAKNDNMFSETINTSPSEDIPTPVTLVSATAATTKSTTKALSQIDNKPVTMNNDEGVIDLGTNDALNYEEKIGVNADGVKTIHRVVYMEVGEEQADKDLKAKYAPQTSSKMLGLEEVQNNQKVKSNFNGAQPAFFAHVSNVDERKENTTICFEDKTCKPLVVSGTLGGSVSTVSFKNCDRPYLLFTAKLRDENFDKHFLYVLRNNEWKEVVNGFAVHKSNKAQITDLVAENPENPNELLRYYSVFDISDESSGQYQWKLLQESVKYSAK